MAFKGTHFTVPGAGSFPITGVGFRPQAVVFLWSNQPTEDVWVQATDDPVGGGMGIASVTSPADSTIQQMSISEIYQNQGIAGSVGSDLSDHAISMALTRNPRAYDFQISVSSFDSDGATLNVTTAPSGTRHVYCLWIGAANDVASWRFSNTFTQDLGTETDAFFVVGSGGTADFPRIYLTSTWLGLACGGFHPLYSSMGLGRGLFHEFFGDLDPQQWNIQHDLGGDPTVFQLLLLHVEPFVFGSNISTWLQIKEDLPTSIETFQPLSGSQYLGLHIGECQASGGHVEAGTVDTPQVVTTGIDAIPEAIFLIGPQQFLANVAVAGQSLGFRTADFECCVAWGGPDGGPGSAFTSRDRSWVSGFFPPYGVSPISEGQTDIGTTPGQFTITPRQLDNSFKTVWWEAFFPFSGPVLVSLSKPGVHSNDLSRARG